METTSAETNNSPGIDCSTSCISGCVRPDNCPGQQHVIAAASFIDNISIDKMHEIAEEARRKKLSAPPQWVIPEWNE
jgi:hypothetical protein